ncbi:MAG: hypothetical protein H0A75_08995 [Candidatus Methanofishera endochildressiae]|uniref:Uncharacterized protein n=1 Tax=Candidatus Methanofishera endochildressiae TaxID=2738884 RepID=A0A7Z0MQ34_9GAMM|nr:hypothetical protein [Candidatus Methanofishera endochildressiae]
MTSGLIRKLKSGKVNKSINSEKLPVMGKATKWLALTANVGNHCKAAALKPTPEVLLVD